MTKKEELIKRRQELMGELAEVNKELNGENDKILKDIEQIIKSNKYVLIVDNEEALGSVKNYIIVKCDEFSYDIDGWDSIRIQGVKLVFFCDSNGKAMSYKMPENWNIGKPAINARRILEGRFSGIEPEALKTLIKVNVASAYSHADGNCLNAIECALKMTIGCVKVSIED